MTETPSTPSPESSSSTTPPPPRPRVLRTVLLVILVVMLLAYLWEYRAKNKHQEAFQTLKAALQESLEKAGDNRLTPAEVQKLVGHEPAGGELEVHEDYSLERYLWHRGLPWQTYVIYAVYQGEEQPTLCYITIGELLEEDLPKTEILKGLPPEDWKEGGPAPTEASPKALPDKTTDVPSPAPEADAPAPNAKDAAGS